MSTSNEIVTVLRQALEALEQRYPFKVSIPNAITSLRAAIASYSQAIAEAEKTEPVAHFGSAYVNENGVHVTTVLGPVAIPQDAKLYTSPPQRQPLTDEQIMWLWSLYSPLKGIASFARSIEAAHGIKGEV